MELDLVSKSLTHIFMIMREKAIQRKSIYQNSERFTDHSALMQEENMEMGINLNIQPSPEWTFQVEEMRYIIMSTEDKVKKLTSLQRKLLHCPSLDDNSDDEIMLNDLISDIRMSMERCQSLLFKIKRSDCSGREAILNKNVIRALANSLQCIKNDFITACNYYSSSLHNLKKSSSFLQDFDEHDGSEQTNEQLKAWNNEKLSFLLENNSAMVEEREKSVQNILKSTLEVNQLFKDVAVLITEQGTVVDQIECNIETSSHKVKSGAEQLKKAHSHQKKSRKMMCVMGLAGGVIFLIILLVILKS